MDSHVEIFDKIVRTRRSVRLFDQSSAFDHQSVDRAIEWAVLAPNSSNLQLWEFYRIKSDEKRRAAESICLHQQAAKTAKELVVIVGRRDLWKERAKFNLQNLDLGLQSPKQANKVKSYYSRLIPFVYTSDRFGFLGGLKSLMTFVFGLFKPMYRQMRESDLKSVVHKSCALAAENFMLGMVAQGYGSCPMEGFDSRRMAKLLNLSRRATINMVIAVGPVNPKGIYGKQLRVPIDSVQFSL